MILRRKAKPEPRPLVAYLDWVDDEQTELRWHAGWLDQSTIQPRSQQPSVGYQLEAVRNTLPHLDKLALVRSGTALNVMHRHVAQLASVALLDRSYLRNSATNYQMTRPTVIIAPASLLTLAEEDDARRLAAELTVAYAVVPLDECTFEWVGEK